MGKQIDRRSLLKTAGATAALAGFGLSAPAVHSANEKVVRYLGTGGRASERGGPAQAREGHAYEGNS